MPRSGICRPRCSTIFVLRPEHPHAKNLRNWISLPCYTKLILLSYCRPDGVHVKFQINQTYMMQLSHAVILSVKDAVVRSSLADSASLAWRCPVCEVCTARRQNAVPQRPQTSKTSAVSTEAGRQATSGRRRDSSVHVLLIQRRHWRRQSIRTLTAASSCAHVELRGQLFKSLAIRDRTKWTRNQWSYGIHGQRLLSCAYSQFSKTSTP